MAKRAVTGFKLQLYYGGISFNYLTPFTRPIGRDQFIINGTTNEQLIIAQLREEINYVHIQRLY